MNKIIRHMKKEKDIEKIDDLQPHILFIIKNKIFYQQALKQIQVE